MLRNTVGVGLGRHEIIRKLSSEASLLNLSNQDKVIYRVTHDLSDVCRMQVQALGFSFERNELYYRQDTYCKGFKESHIQALTAAYPPSRYYTDPVQMRDSIRRSIMFNIIDTERLSSSATR